MDISESRIITLFVTTHLYYSSVITIVDLPWFTLLSNIPCESRKKEALVKIVKKREGTNKSMLNLIMKTTLRARLKSIKPRYYHS